MRLFKNQAKLYLNNYWILTVTAFKRLIIGTNSMERKKAILHIGEYNIKKEEWSILHKETHRFLMFKEPRYYNALVGIRFEIGGEEEVYIKK